MNNTGFRAFLLGTARDQVPVRGIWFTAPKAFNLPVIERQKMKEPKSAS
jgi:hypothetical protein